MISLKQPWIRDFFWPIMTFLIGFKLFLVADIAVHIRFSPIDDSLYVTRAYELLSGNEWGNYSPYVLAKLPGISLWLAATRLTGIPYILGINLAYIFAGLFLVNEANKIGINKIILLIAYFCFLFNPITFSTGWALPMREGVSSILMIFLLGLSLRILLSSKDGICFASIIFWAITFGFIQIMREEDILIWAYLILFISSVVWIRYDWVSRRFDFRDAIILLVASSLFTGLIGYGVRSYNHSHYGLPILSDFSEGEFPKLIAALRGVDSSVDNRLVMLPQEVIVRLRTLIPDFTPVLDRLPLPGAQTFSCKLQGVCSEWSNGWMLWWIKKSAADAGFTPTLLEGQAYFRLIREQIEALCASEKLHCHQSGAGIVPPMQLRWFRAFTQEFTALTLMFLYPDIEIISEGDLPVNAASSLVDIYRQVTMTNVIMNSESEVVAATNGGPQTELRKFIAPIIAILNLFLMPFGAFALIWRWIMYPTVHPSPLFLLCSITWIYVVIRLLALTYLAVYFGPYESRIIFSSYTALGVLSFLAIWDANKARKEFKLIGLIHA